MLQNTSDEQYYLTLLSRSHTPKTAPAIKTVNPIRMNEGVVKVIIVDVERYYFLSLSVDHKNPRPNTVPAKKIVRKIRISAGIVNVIICYR